MKSGGWIAYVGPFLFPWGQPGSRRVYGIARSIEAAGFRVVVGSGENEPSVPTQLSGAANVSYLGLRELHEPGQGLLSKVHRLLIAQGTRTVQWLGAQDPKPSHVIAYGGYGPFIARLSSWCDRNRVPLIADVVEWYEGSHMLGGRFGPFHLNAEYALRRQFHRCAGVIAISSYLQTYYRQRGTKVVCVPPTLDVMDVPVQASSGPGRPLKLIYAGSPGKKDLLGNVIRGISALDPGGQRVRLNVLGPTLRELSTFADADGRLPPFLHAMGRVPQQEVAAAYGAADFSVLLREPARFSNAGFPTKVPESLASCVPVICNLTSDIGAYVHDGVEGLICRDNSAEAFVVALERALSMPSSERARMRRAARAAAERWFDYRVYVEALRDFLVEVQA